MGIYFVEPGADIGANRVVYDRAGSAFAAITADTIDWTRALTGAAWLHGSGITPALGEGPRAALAAAIRAARAAGASVSVDLNYRPALWQGRDPRAVIEPLVREADLLIANRDAVRTMLGVDASPDDATLAPRLAARYGLRRVALTRREVLSASEHRWSASLYDATTGSSNDSRHHDVRVVDRVGGGDSFAAGLVAALLRGRPGPEAVEFGAAAGALKLGVPGDWSRASPQDVEQLVRACA